MRMLLNNYKLNWVLDPSCRAFLNDEVQGLDLPDLDSSVGEYASRPGGYTGQQRDRSRAITLIGTLFSSSASTHYADRRALQEALRAQNFTLQIDDLTGNSYVIYCKRVDFKMPMPRMPNKSPFKIELRADDPIIYDNNAGSDLVSSLARIVSGGFIYPVVYPIIYAAASSPSTVTNSGLVTVLPVITLTGAMTNPVIKNETTGRLISLTNLTTGPNDVVKIDMRARSILLNGQNALAFRDNNLSTWWGIQPGDNTISLTTSGSNDTVTGEVRWRNGYMGI